MGFLGTRAGPFADLTLIIQIAGFIILCLGVMYVKRRNFLRHFKMTRVAVFIGVIAFIWMVSSLIINFQAIIYHITNLRSLLTVVHVIIGVPALLTGISFALDRLIKKISYNMRSVFLLWTSALFLGIIVYISYYIY